MESILINHSSRDNLAALAVTRWLETHGWGADEFFLDLHVIGAQIGPVPQHEDSVSGAAFSKDKGPILHLERTQHRTPQRRSLGGIHPRR